jgi:predicted phage tail protein
MIKGSKGGCFPAGTLISTPNGEIPIESISNGDEVLCFDAMGDLYTSEAYETITHETNDLIFVEYWGGFLRCTPNHWVLNQFNTFVPAEGMTTDDALVDENGHLRPITAIRKQESAKVYNFKVEEYHTYIASGIRVHNGGNGLGSHDDYLSGSKGNSGGKGGGGTIVAPKEAPNTLRSKSTARLIDLISEGEIFGLADQVNPAKSIFLDGTALQNSDGSFNFEGITFIERKGLPDQDVINGFSGSESEITVNTEVTDVAPVIFTVTDSDVSAVRVKVQLPTLLSQTPNGDLNGSTNSFKIELQPNGQSYSTIRTVTITGKTVGPYQEQYRIEMDEGALRGTRTPYNVRVTRITPLSESASLQNQLFVSSYTEIIDVDLIYPDSALIAMTADSELFGGRVPSRAYDIKGIKVQIPDNYDPITRVYTGIWSGAFQTDWTDNPAWILYDLLVNSRYGLGKTIVAAQVDKFAFFTIAQYCDELVETGFGTATSYDDGDRTLSIATSTDLTLTTGTINNLVDGSEVADAAGSTQFSAETVAGKFIKFDFTNPRIIDEAIWLQGGTPVTQGTWKWQGSTDDSIWVDIGVSFEITAVASLTMTQLNGNTTEYQYYRLLGISGSSEATAWQTEINFKIDGDKEPRFVANIIINNRQEAYAVLNALSSIFRGMVYWSAGVIVPSQDAPTDATRIVNEADVKGGLFNYSGSALKARHSTALVTWNDPEDEYSPRVEVIEDLDLVQTLNTPPIEVVALGTTSRGQAHRMGKWILDSEKNETETVNYQAGMDHHDTRPGEVIKISDSSRIGARLSGRIAAISGVNVTLDADYTFVAGDSIILQAQDDTIETIALVSNVSAAVLEMATAPAVTVVPPALFLIVQAALEPTQWRVLANKQIEKNLFEITALKHDPTKYARVESDITLDTTPTSLLPTGPLTGATNLVVNESLTKVNGKIRTRVSMSWLASTDSRVTFYRVETKAPNDNNFQILQINQATTAEIEDAEAGDWTFAVSAMAGGEVAGNQTSRIEVEQTILGKTAPPADVTGFTAQQNGDVLTLRWDEVQDIDLAFYIVRYALQGTFDWTNAISLNEKVSATAILDVTIPPGLWTIGIRAIDTSDNLSDNVSTVNVDFAVTDIIFEVEQDPRWQGFLSNFVKHSVSTALIPKSLTLADDDGVFDSFVLNPEATCYFEAEEIDTGLDFDQLKIFQEVTALLGPGETVGFADPKLDVDFRLEAGAYDGFETVSGALVVNARRVKTRSKIITATGVACVLKFKPILDVTERTEGPETETTVGVGGSTFTFASPFNTAPVVRVDYTGPNPRVATPSLVTTTDFLLTVYQISDGASVALVAGESVEWTAIGA